MRQARLPSCVHYRGRGAAASTAPRRMAATPLLRRVALGIGTERAAADAEDIELFAAARRSQRHRLAFALFQERAGHRRDPADIAALGVDLIDADDADRSLVAVLVRDRNRRTEIHGRFRVIIARSGWIDNFRRIETPNEKADAPIDLAQPLLAIDVIAVLGAIAVARRPGNGRDELGSLGANETIQLAAQARESARRHVVARARRQWR